ncbi:MAG: FAD-dependent oxidoreductase [Pseudomonadota bacterium]
MRPTIEFPFLFSPIRVNQMDIKNRIVMAAMQMGYARDGEITDRLIDFYVRRAVGGAGLIIAGACTISEEAGPPNMISIRDDRYIPQLKRLSNAVQSRGSRVAAQLNHSGAAVHSSLIGGRTPVSASAVGSTLTGETPRALELEEILAVQDKYAAAALRVKEAGFDAVEVLGGYLIQQFLSPLCNVREDEYGGSGAGRMHFGIEVARKVRKAVGPDFPLLFRVLGNEFMPGGFTNDDVCLFASELEKVGVDLINVTGGRHETRVPQITMIVPRRTYAYLAQRIKSFVSIPVLSSNRVNDPADAEEIIRNGQADLVAMARAMLADPDLPQKARTGKSNLIYHCIGCNQGCLDNVFRSQPVTCLVNPSMGMEKEWRPSSTPRPKKVIVVGGGPAGMKAACTAAERGHQVTLAEKEDRLGGQLLLNHLIPGRQEMITAAMDLINNLKALKVEVHLGREVDAPFIKELAPEVVVIASGATPILPNLPGVEGDQVVLAWDLLAGQARTGKKVVIVGGNAVGLETALYLGSQGTLSHEAFHFLTVHRAESSETLSELLNKGNKEVTVVEMAKRAGQDIGASTRWIVMAELKRLGVSIRTGTKALGITPEGLKVETEGGPDFLPADSIVIAAGSKPENRLAGDIQGLVPEVHLVGDAKEPRNALEAIREGFMVGLKI